MLNLTRLDLQETRFRMERLSKTTQIRGADKKNIKERCRNEVKIHEKPASEPNKKQCLKTELKKTNKSQKLTQEWLKKLSLFWGKSHRGAFGGPNRFCDGKIGPQRYQSAPKNET